MTNILLVGGGKGGFALLKLLSRKRLINIVGICDISPNAPAIKLAEIQGYKTVSRGQIADAAECAASLISHYFGDVPALRQAIMREAIEIENIEIILQGLVVKDGLALGAPKPLRVRAFNLLDQQV